MKLYKYTNVTNFVSFEKKTRFAKSCFTFHFCLSEDTAGVLYHQMFETKDCKYLKNMTEASIETKTIVFWTNLYRWTAPSLTSWSHCSNDIKGPCVLTKNRSQHQVCVMLPEILFEMLVDLFLYIWYTIYKYTAVYSSLNCCQIASFSVNV